MTAPAEPGRHGLAVVARADGPHQIVAAGDVPQRLRALTEQTVVDWNAIVAMSPEDLFAASVRAVKQSTVLMAMAGWCFQRVMEMSPYGTGWYAEQAALHGISKSTIYNAIDVYRVLMECPEDVPGRLGKFGYTKLLTLKKLTPLEWESLAAGEEIADGVTLDLLEELSADEIRRRLRARDTTIGHYKRQIEKSKHTIDVLQERVTALAGRDQADSEPRSVRRAREAGTGYGLAAQNAVAQIVALADELIRAPDLASDSQRRQRDLRDGLTPIWYALAAARAAADQAMHDLREAVPRYLPADGEMSLLSRDEVQAAIDLFHTQMPVEMPAPAQRGPKRGGRNKRRAR